ncbi:MAG: DEAD/DEAH box helicase family protein, partial [Candidatus Cloacimonetes bacterium]|nr:DEAD/DEAH box helicase family protein [Candidatus Cloacimonadota bacterium]
TSLSYKQKERITRSKITSLESLDLAALLRVFDSNWHLISTQNNIEPEQRHYMKEMQTIRNRWAHPDSNGVNAEDKYRDLDTLKRFLMIINPSSALIIEVDEAKKKSLNIEAQILEVEVQNTMEMFKVGQQVCLKTNPELKGIVTEVLKRQTENKYIVYINNDEQSYYESQLLPVTKGEMKRLKADDFHAAITAIQIKYPNLSTLYSLNSARIDFIPYQFRPVLKFIKSDRPRLLIADSVGVGKTIEAGLILKELQARRDMKSILIICPKPLVVEKKWLNEMQRFDEKLTQLGSKELRWCIDECDKDGVWPEHHRKAIVPYSLFDDNLLMGDKSKRKKGLIDLDPPPKFDLVIVDEAHHIRNTNTSTYKVTKFFCENAEAVLFLTATPIQLGSKDLFVLLNLLRPDLIIDKNSFKNLSEPNPFINQAAKTVRYAEPDWQITAKELLLQAAETSWGRAIVSQKLEFKETIEELSKPKLTDQQRMKILNDIEGLHSFNSIINRTRRRDIGSFTTRHPETVLVDYTPEQSLVHDEVLNIQKQILSIFHGNESLKFLMSTIRRQVASSIFGLVPFLKKMLNRQLDELEWDEMGESIPNQSIIDDIREQINTIIEICHSLSGDDPKYNALKKIITDKQKLPNNKLMLFSSFRHTLHYLFNKLSAENLRIGLIHGGVKDEDRTELRRRFELPKEDEESIDVMLFSEVGCEGLDYQFCDAMVNYDLPWNPMKIEQRIGRIDRNGQKSDKVVIYNLITPNTIDAEIYERCLLRIGVFESSIGDTEEILGDITKEIKDIAEDFTLTKEEREAKLKQLADNQIRKIQEEEILEKKQHELFGIEVPQTRMNEEIKSASSLWLSPEMIERSINHYLRTKLGKEQEFILGDKEAKTLRLSQEARNELLNDYKALGLHNKKWQDWLKGSEPHFSMTFDTGYAMKNHKTELINPIHPLSKQAAEFSSKVKEPYTIIKAYDSELKSGTYDFAIYKWEVQGIKKDLVLKPICSDKAVEDKIISLLETAEDCELLSNTIIEKKRWNYLDERHYEQWTAAKQEHAFRINELVKNKKESLFISHKARITAIQDIIDNAENEKIIRMHKASIENA